MKTILTMASVLSMVLSMTALAHPATAATRPGLTALPQGAPLKTIQGTVKADGEKVIFVADEDNKPWEVTNPEILKPHVGHHVEISGHVNADKSQIHVMSVKMAKKAEK